jgi:hypothetical protein
LEDFQEVQVADFQELELPEMGNWMEKILREGLRYSEAQKVEMKC